MDAQPIKRRLTAILATDAVGYSARMAEDEEGTHRTLAGHRRIIDALIAEHGGRIVGTAGDSVLAEFGSSVEAVRSAVEIQEALATRNNALAEPQRLLFRIGINLGDVIVEGDDILGDGVNVASRLESIAEPGGICISSSVFDQISGKLNLGFLDIGERSLKNISRPVRAFKFDRVIDAPRAPASPRTAPERRKNPVVWMAGTAGAVVLALGAAYFAGTLGGNGGAPAAAADGAAASASTEETRLKLQIAEAERAKAEAELARARAESEATRNTPATNPASRAPAATAALQAAPATPLPAPPPAAATAASGGQQTALRPADPPGGEAAAFTRGSALVRCARIAGANAVNATVPVQVVDGEVIIALGESGQPGSVNLHGRPAGDGSLVIEGVIIGRGRAGEFAARYAGQLKSGRGMLAGRQGRQPCSIALRLM